MSRRCLICADINPCAKHSDADQTAELARNDAAIAAIRLAEVQPKPNAKLVAPIMGPLPSGDSFKIYHTWNEVTVVTVTAETEDKQVVGAVALGISSNGRADGVAVYNTVEEAERLYEILGRGIADAKRISAGERPVAKEVAIDERIHNSEGQA